MHAGCLGDVGGQRVVSAARLAEASTVSAAGAGGSWAGADPERGVAVTKNVMSMDFATVDRVGGAVLAEIDR